MREQVVVGSYGLTVPLPKTSQATTVRLSVLTTLLLLVAACGTTTPPTPSASIKPETSDRDRADVASVGAGSDILTLAGYFPNADELGETWGEANPTAQNLLECEKTSPKTLHTRYYQSYDPELLLVSQVSFIVAEAETEDQALELIDLVVGSKADECDRKSADAIDSLLAQQTGGTYTVDRNSLVGETSEPAVELASDFDSVDGRRYQFRYVGDVGELQVTAEMTVMRRGTLVVAVTRAAPTESALPASPLPLFAQMANELSADGWGKPDRPTTLDESERDRLDTTVVHLIAMMPADEEVPARLNLAFVGEVLRPDRLTTCTDPDADELVAESSGPLWQATSGQVGELLLHHGYVFQSPAAASSYIERVTADPSCYQGDNPLIDFGVVPPDSEVTVTIHPSMVDDRDVVELRAVATQLIADVELDLVASVFVTQNENSVSAVLYIGLLDDQAEFAELVADAGERGGPLP